MRIEIRAKNDATIEGYVNAVGRDSRVMTDIKHGKFVEQVKPGTFQRALDAASDVQLKLNHQRELGSRSAGDVELHEDSIGLYARAHVTDEEVITAAEKKELRGWSFSFNNLKDEWEAVSDTVSRRRLEEIRLLEVSILTVTPAYIATSIEMRGETAEIVEERCVEDNRVEVRKAPEQPPDDTKCGGEGQEKEKAEIERKKKELELLEMED